VREEPGIDSAFDTVSGIMVISVVFVAFGD